jgi:hypothetical protein
MSAIKIWFEITQLKRVRNSYFGPFWELLKYKIIHALAYVTVLVYRHAIYLRIYITSFTNCTVLGISGK